MAALGHPPRRGHEAALCCRQVELQEVVDFFTKPKLFRSSGARIPKGVLLCGPPGASSISAFQAVCL